MVGFCPQLVTVLTDGELFAKAAARERGQYMSSLLRRNPSQWGSGQCR